MFHCKILAFVWGGLFCFCRRVHVLIICKRCIRVYCTSVFFWQKQHSYADWSCVVTICLNAWTEIEFTPKSAKCKSQGYLKKNTNKKNTNKNPHKNFFLCTTSDFCCRAFKICDFWARWGPQLYFTKEEADISTADVSGTTQTTKHTTEAFIFGEMPL